MLFLLKEADLSLTYTRGTQATLIQSVRKYDILIELNVWLLYLEQR